jgi:hypothetical protein
MMLPVIDGCSKNSLYVTTDAGKKKMSKTYSFHLDTGDVARKVGKTLQSAAEDGYSSASRYLKRKYRKMKVQKALTNMRKSVIDAVKIEIPFKILKSRMRKFVHA